MTFKGSWLNPTTTEISAEEQKLNYVLQLADDALILGQQLSQWCSRGPVLEQDIAIINIALDHIGRARLLYQYAADLKGDDATEDDFAYHRDTNKFKNFLLIEQDNGHWGDTLARSFFIDTYNFYYYDKLTKSTDAQLAAIATKALKEITYHAQWSAEWMIRLGDGTAESHQKIQQSINDLWMFTGELFEDNAAENDMAKANIGVVGASIKKEWDAKVGEVLSIATLQKPTETWMQTGGRKGIHTEKLDYILFEMQAIPRAYPNEKW